MCDHKNKRKGKDVRSKLSFEHLQCGGCLTYIIVFNFGHKIK